MPYIKAQLIRSHHFPDVVRQALQRAIDRLSLSQAQDQVARGNLTSEKFMDYLRRSGQGQA